MTAICPHCGEEKKFKGFSIHKIACEKIYSLKDKIIEDYLSKKSLKKIHEEYGVDATAISVMLKKSGIIVRSGDDGKYKNHNNIDESYFDEIDSSEKAWLIGLLAADGCISKEGSLSIGQSGDAGHKLITHIKKILNISNKISISKTIGKDFYSIGARNKNIAYHLSRYNIVNNKTLRYTFPLALPSEFYKDFIRGYIEGDGCIGVYKNNKGYESLSVSFVGTKEFIHQCYEVIPVKASGINICSGSSKVIEIRWSGRHAIAFCDWVFSTENLYISYKCEKYKNFSKKIKDSPPRYIILEKLMIQAKELSSKGLNPMEISKIIKIPFQTIYKWKKREYKSYTR